MNRKLGLERYFPFYMQKPLLLLCVACLCFFKAMPRSCTLRVPHSFVSAASQAVRSGVKKKIVAVTHVNKQTWMPLGFKRLQQLRNEEKAR